jgi:putative transcriptional regulator
MSSDLRVPAGTLLASSPDLLDANFMHTVSLMCEHGEAGAYGLVLNKLSSLTLDRLLPDHPVFGSLALPVAWGGPVGSDTLQILHRYPDVVTGGFRMADDLVLGGDLDEVAALFESGPPEAALQGVRFVLGYAGWGAGQLEGELEAGSWLPLPPDTDLVFARELGSSEQQLRLWQRAVRGLGREGEGLADLPPDIGWN